MENEEKWLKDGIRAFKKNNIDGQWNKEIADFERRLKDLYNNLNKNV